MTKQQAVELYQTLNGFGNLTGSRFAYAVAKNLNHLKSEIQALEAAVKPLPGFEAYDTARVELAKSHAQKDEKGEPIVKGNQFVIEDLDAFNKALEELKAEHKETLDIRQTQIDEYIKLLKEDAAITLHKVKLEDVPKEVTVNQMMAIQEFIEQWKKSCPSGTNTTSSR